MKPTKLQPGDIEWNADLEARWDTYWNSGLGPTVQAHDSAGAYNILTRKCYDTFSALKPHIQVFNAMCDSLDLDLTVLETPVHCVNDEMARRFRKITTPLGFKRIGRTYSSLVPEIGKLLKDYRFVVLIMLRQIDVMSQTNKFVNLILMDGYKGIVWYYDPIYERTVKAPKPVGRLAKLMTSRINHLWDVWDFLAPWKEVAGHGHLYHIFFCLMQWVRYGQMPVVPDPYGSDYPQTEEEAEGTDITVQPTPLAPTNTPEPLADSTQEVLLGVDSTGSLKLTEDSEGFLNVSGPGGETHEVLLVTEYQAVGSDMCATGAAFITKDEAIAKGLIPEGSKMESSDDEPSPTTCEAQAQTETSEQDKQAILELSNSLVDPESTSGQEEEVEALEQQEDEGSDGGSDKIITDVNLAQQLTRSTSVPALPLVEPFPMVSQPLSSSMDVVSWWPGFLGQGNEEMQPSSEGPQHDLEPQEEPPHIVSITEADPNTVELSVPLDPGFSLGELIELPMEFPVPDFSMAAGTSTPPQEQAEENVRNITEQLSHLLAQSPPPDIRMEVSPRHEMEERSSAATTHKDQAPEAAETSQGTAAQQHVTASPIPSTSRRPLPVPPGDVDMIPYEGSTDEEPDDPALACNANYAMSRAEPDLNLYPRSDEEIFMSSDDTSPSIASSDYEWFPKGKGRGKGKAKAGPQLKMKLRKKQKLPPTDTVTEASGESTPGRDTVSEWEFEAGTDSNRYTFVKF